MGLCNGFVILLLITTTMCQFPARLPAQLPTDLPQTLPTNLGNLTNFTGAISGLVTDVLNGTNVTNLFNSTGLSNPSQSIAAVNNLTNTTGLPSPSEAIAALNNLTNSTGLPSPSEAIAALNNFTNLNLTNLTSLASDLLNSTTLSPESLLDQLNSTLPSSSEALAALANLTNDPSAAITSLSATVANLTTIISGAVSSVPPLPAISVSGSGSSASASNASGSSSPSPSPSPSAFASRTGVRIAGAYRQSLLFKLVPRSPTCRMEQGGPTNMVACSSTTQSHSGKLESILVARGTFYSHIKQYHTAALYRITET